MSLIYHWISNNLLSSQARRDSYKIGLNCSYYDICKVAIHLLQFQTEMILVVCASSALEILVCRKGWLAYIPSGAFSLTASMEIPFYLPRMNSIVLCLDSTFMFMRNGLRAGTMSRNACSVRHHYNSHCKFCSGFHSSISHWCQESQSKQMCFNRFLSKKSLTEISYQGEK